MMNNLLGIYEKAYNNKFTFAEKCKITKQLGFDFMELSIDETLERQRRLDFTDKQIEEMKAAIQCNGLKVQSLCLSAHRGSPFGSQNQSTREKAYEIIEKAMIFAEKLGIRNIQLAGYDVYYEESNLQTEKAYVEGLRYCARLAEKYQVMLSIEIMDTNFIGTLSAGNKYVQIINSPWLKLYLDIGNCYQHSYDIYDEINTYLSEIVQIHIKDTTENKFRDYNLGEGVVPIHDIKNFLEDKNYSGPYVLEIWGKDNMEKGDNIENIKYNFKYFLDKHV